MFTLPSIKLCLLLLPFQFLLFFLRYDPVYCIPCWGCDWRRVITIISFLV